MLLLSPQFAMAKVVKMPPPNPPDTSISIVSGGLPDKVAELLQQGDVEEAIRLIAEQSPRAQEVLLLQVKQHLFPNTF